MHGLDYVAEKYNVDIELGDILLDIPIKYLKDLSNSNINTYKIIIKNTTNDTVTVNGEHDLELIGCNELEITDLKLKNLKLSNCNNITIISDDVINIESTDSIKVTIDAGYRITHKIRIDK